MTEPNLSTGGDLTAAPHVDLPPDEAVVPSPQLPSPSSQAVVVARPPFGGPPVPRKQGAWGLWWLCLITFSIYYLVWYDRINSELATVLGQPRRANSQWWNQLIPIWNLVGLGATAKRLNAAHTLVGSPTQVGVFTSWFWAPAWFASQTRYLQRRVNILHDVLASQNGPTGS
ncbi:DUF4234 domain-containing protein [Frankia sp. AgB1.9]|uniref:DUF4234 domain-containing protein n=1 Tax=unclassified Frankia TaxID=2632575 RepID=UPI001933B048|nr:MULTISPECIES: DUF4234 domain-containing protein [unclassified Frankia]MBL7487307.1 DUF4234 domain-containing protein [Frankia sp. AgW1.1]MBL7546314.1 DUF4234 domain-containing protein [Frankia sp. AgB1.9]MBL7618641.1 DUF4234 domain-containing protein [Frankia sp. AgB1.8]